MVSSVTGIPSLRLVYASGCVFVWFWGVMSDSMVFLWPTVNIGNWVGSAKLEAQMKTFKQVVCPTNEPVKFKKG